MLNRAAFGQKRENRLRAVANSFTAFMDDNGSLADKARNTVVTMTAAGHHNPAWPVFHVEDFAEFRIRDDFDGDRRPPFGELFAIWQSLRKDHPLRDAFTTADLLDLKIGACVVLTDNKLIAADRAGLPRIFELADVRRMTKLGRDALMRRQREAAEQADRDRIEAEERYRASPEGKIAALESEVKALREQLAARA
jgi:hypothetical protein